MKDAYGNKMIDGYQNKFVPKYIGSFEVWIPKLGKKIKTGDMVPDFPIEEAITRDDFILVKEK